MSRPAPTARALGLLAVGLLPAALSIAFAPLLHLALALDAAVLLLCAWDFFRAPGAEAVRVTRQVAPVLSCGAWNPVTLTLEPRTERALSGELRDGVPPGPRVEGHRQPFRLPSGAHATKVGYRLLPVVRGDLAFTGVHLRLHGPFGLCARQVRAPLSEAVKVYPDLSALTREALKLSLAHPEQSRAVVKKPSEAGEFESLRDYRPGDDVRTIDWKATARRARTLVRVYEPERNQPVLLLLDCGRHMAGLCGERRKLDHAVDAALRLARVSLDRGDLVGVVAFGRDVGVHLPPRRGPDHLRALTSALYRVEATFEESDYGRALDVAFARHHRRSLVVLFTDLQDPDTASHLVSRTVALRPRHLPVVVSLVDPDLARAASEVPGRAQGAYVRQVAARLEDGYRRTTAELRNAGALAVRAPASSFGAAALNAYLGVKARGLL